MNKLEPASQAARFSRRRAGRWRAASVITIKHRPVSMASVPETPVCGQRREELNTQIPSSRLP
jgi:hypothetical protein